MAPPPASETASASVASQVAVELQRNRELTAQLYSLRGEVPPSGDGAESAHSMMREPKEGERRSYEVYTGMPGVDSLYSGLSKRTPNGGFFSS